MIAVVAVLWYFLVFDAMPQEAGGHALEQRVPKDQRDGFQSRGECEVVASRVRRLNPRYLTTPCLRSGSAEDNE